jgi:hypothetical protein
MAMLVNDSNGLPCPQSDLIAARQNLGGFYYGTQRKAVVRLVDNLDKKTTTVGHKEWKFDYSC